MMRTIVNCVEFWGQLCGGRRGERRWSLTLGSLLFVAQAAHLAYAAPPIETQRYRQGGLPPQAGLAAMKVSDDLQIEQLFAEPAVEQPVFINFDERGRMWVVQYRQYPHPAGLKIVSRDNFWRNVYDRVPEPPPRHTSGKDRITIHSDTDGDGRYDHTELFVDGLNMATAVERGRGGIWVLNPPYLLFYPDRDRDDVPDGDPRVVLSGFGLEDSHSLVNSLRWGPDGWLYAAQGSTVTAQVVQPGSDSPPIYSQGQLIWRYHPERQEYEIFAEGGGNAFGVEFDAQGRIFSGHNGGDTRGFHYVQGGYFQKGFNKHGPLSNPYAFGYFAAMRHPPVERFTHTFAIYEASSMPDRFRGKLLGVEPLQGRVVMSSLQPIGSSFATEDVEHPITSDDRWFRPVDIKVGPDGAVYVADWYDGQVNHYRNHEGEIDPSNGRIYRLSARQSGSAPTNLEPARDWAAASSAELVDALKHHNKWVRQTALRILGDRRDRSVIPQLNQTLDAREPGQLALESLWALNLSGGLTDERQGELLQHPDPYVRLWTVRLAADDRQVSAQLGQRLLELAVNEPHLEVRVQLACSARRLPVDLGARIAWSLAGHEEDVMDGYQPLLIWWALENFCSRDPEQLLRSLKEQRPWGAAMFQQHLASRLMRRFAQAGTRSDLVRCAELLNLAPDRATGELFVAGFQQAFSGRAVAGLPTELARALTVYANDNLEWRLRLGDEGSVQEALERIVRRDVPTAERTLLIDVLGEIKASAAVAPLLLLVQAGQAGELGPAENAGQSEAIWIAALNALSQFDEPAIVDAIMGAYAGWPTSVQQVAQATLVTRAAWALRLVDAVTQGKIDPVTINLETLRRCLDLNHETLSARVKEHWGELEVIDVAAAEATIVRFTATIDAQLGDPYRGHKLYVQHCGACHRMFGEGGQVGPDLTSFNRTDLGKMLLSVVLPSAEIREGFESYLVVLNDGRVINGVLQQRDPNTLVFRTGEGKLVTVERAEVETMQVQSRSIMPTGLLDKLTENELRDLFAYLRSTQPLPE